MAVAEQQILSILNERLGEYRLRHSLEVAKESRTLALLYGADEEKAYTAGLLHDVMKETDEKRQLQILRDFGILLDKVEESTPKLWHAISGAVFIRHYLHIEDEDILNAVRFHTVGREGMSLLEKILFVADFTSADRDYPDVEVMRRLSRESLDAAIDHGVIYTIRELAASGSPIHPNTVALYNENRLNR